MGSVEAFWPQKGENPCDKIWNVGTAPGASCKKGVFCLNHCSTTFVRAWLSYGSSWVSWVLLLANENVGFDL